eukprot:XP_001703547.1 predicted protein [Chlamydomonas reinhardtii]
MSSAHAAETGAAPPPRCPSSAGLPNRGLGPPSGSSGAGGLLRNRLGLLTGTKQEFVLLEGRLLGPPLPPDAAAVRVPAVVNFQLQRALRTCRRWRRVPLQRAVAAGCRPGSQQHPAFRRMRFRSSYVSDAAGFAPLSSEHAFALLSGWAEDIQRSAATTRAVEVMNSRNAAALPAPAVHASTTATADAQEKKERRHTSEQAQGTAETPEAEALPPAHGAASTFATAESNALRWVEAMSGSSISSEASQTAAAAGDGVTTPLRILREAAASPVAAAVASTQPLSAAPTGILSRIASVPPCATATANADVNAGGIATGLTAGAAGAGGPPHGPGAWFLIA